MSQFLCSFSRWAFENDDRFLFTASTEISNIKYNFSYVSFQINNSPGVQYSPDGLNGAGRFFLGGRTGLLLEAIGSLSSFLFFLLMPFILKDLLNFRSIPANDLGLLLITSSERRDLFVICDTRLRYKVAAITIESSDVLHKNP